MLPRAIAKYMSTIFIFPLEKNDELNAIRLSFARFFWFWNQVASTDQHILDGTLTLGVWDLATAGPKPRVYTPVGRYGNSHFGQENYRFPQHHATTACLHH
ncbi:unnamed protein product [Protopolystoma xenopodis]|uniref:Uncharacterized protein n=1 Tax=Protopolystoma xenopodis TaxID=117903 RepID=A0A448WEQ7_9PLAT|nr:unnamed protein product [Protopolystoma xenopodis]